MKLAGQLRAQKKRNYPKWKASECRSFLLFYSLVVLSPFMKEHYFQHWLLFVVAMFLLLQDSIMESDILKSEVLVRMFLRDFSKLYRAEDFSYNMHNLCHMGLATRLYGPLQESAAFMCESLNGDLRNCIHGTKNFAMELTNTLTLFRGIQVLRSRVEAKNICPDTLTDRSTVAFCSKVKIAKLKAGMRQVVSGANLWSPYYLFYRAVIKGETYRMERMPRRIGTCNLEDTGVVRVAYSSAELCLAP